jgi:translocator protein
MSTFAQVWGLVVSIIVCFGVAWVGSHFTVPSIGNWYSNLNKPVWNPPGWIFGPVWTVLYLLMAVAAWLVWRRFGLSGAAVPLAIFAVQLVLNLAWSIIFFGRNNIGMALADIVLLWLAIILTILAFRQSNALAAWLLIPYLVWVTFASVLNFSIWNMNR